MLKAKQAALLHLQGKITSEGKSNSYYNNLWALATEQQAKKKW